MGDLVELDMSGFHIILGIDWLHAYYSSFYCKTGVVKLDFPNNPRVESSSKMPKGLFIPYLKVIKLVSKGCVYHLV